MRTTKSTPGRFHSVRYDKEQTQANETAIGVRHSYMDAGEAANNSRINLARQHGATTEVVLISMPFGPLFLPSIGLSLLKAALVPLGISSKILYFTFRFAQLIGVSLYTQISDAQKPPIVDLVGEWIFNDALFDPTSLDVEGYIENVLRKSAFVLALALYPVLDHS